MNNSYPKKGKDAYEIKEELGRGGFGIVRRATRICDEKDFAIKVSMRTRDKYLGKELQDIEDEIKHMNQLQHPFIVKIIDDFIDSKDS
jgi:serine/threonine protein kinase